MVVIADTSPLNYLVLIAQAEILPKLYGEVVIPEAVLRELKDPGAPEVVARWIATPPTWLVVGKNASCLSDVPVDLDPGESEAIAFAQANLANVLPLIDEERGRREADRHHQLLSSYGRQTSI